MLVTTIYLMRHGQKSGDSNTPFGLEQLAASADAHLASINLSAVYCSDMKRTMQAAEHILTARANPADAKEITKHPAFFIGHLTAPENMAESVRIDKLLGEHGSTGDWHANWNQARLLTDGIVEALKKMAQEHEGGNVLVCNHSPLCGLAASMDMPAIGLADIVKYTMTRRWEGNGWEIESAELLPCPLKVPTV